MTQAVPDPSESLLGPTTGEHPKQKDARVGTVIDNRYAVERILGEGGMGIVYAARHKMIDKRVAIKVLRGDLAQDKDVTERFLTEAKAASSIGNPHIVDISDFGELADGSTYFVMEYLDGKSLGQLLAETRPLPLDVLCPIAMEVAEGLSAAHAANIVHRDLKPDNIMLVARGTNRHFAKILDFGIAKVGGQTTGRTRAGSVFGTPHYMSPEQAAGTPVDARTDIYSLGVILYEMASGRVPFDADNFMGILTQHMYKAPVPIRALAPPPDVSPGLEAVILKCLSKKPEGRYQTMGELVTDLERLARGEVPAAIHELMARSGGFNVPGDYFRNAMPAPVPAMPRTSAGRKRWPLVAALIAVTTVCVAGVLVLVMGGAKGNVTPATADPGKAPEPAQTAPPKPEAKSLLTVLTVVPTDAKVTRAAEDLSSPGKPVVLSMKDGEEVDLVVSKEGFKSEPVHLRAGESKTITLEKNPQPAVAKGTMTPPTPTKSPEPSKPAAQGGSFDEEADPFLKKKKR